MLLAAATAAPQRHDRRLEAGTHLMHLETGRRISGTFLKLLSALLPRLSPK